jgi:hypothetical protein
MKAVTKRQESARKSWTGLPRKGPPRIRCMKTHDDANNLTPSLRDDQSKQQARGKEGPTYTTRKSQS